MMSPDPPRERDHNQEDKDDPNFVPNWTVGFPTDEDDIWGDADGPYELDLGGDSEYSDSENEQEQPQPGPPPLQIQGDRALDLDLDVDIPILENEEIQTSTRGRYQLLIPFPMAQVENFENGDEIDQNSTQNPSLPPDSTVLNVDEIDDREMEEESPTNSKETKDTEGKRDIDLTDESVETIKNVMRNFTLPSESIPPWAKELTEDSWKNYLPHNSQKNNDSNLNLGERRKES